ncbi:hypothetical protein PSPO01_16045 [Paraphaeosphaeria sporulosa]
MAQLLVLQHAAHENRAGKTDSSNNLVAQLQDRFMVFGSNTPINWILNLCAFGAAIRNNNTADGWIERSDDGPKLTYKSLDLTMNGLRWAVRDQLAEAQTQLHNLLFLPDSQPDTQARLVPSVKLAALKDDPGGFSSGHSILTHPRNADILGECGHKYLLNRIRDDGALRKRFFLNQETLTWNAVAIQQYIQLTHITRLTRTSLRPSA